MRQHTITSFTKPCFYETASKSFSTYNNILQSERKYTKEHEWVLPDGARGTVGITDFAQAELGDIVFVELPEPGTEFTKDDTIGTIESVKAVSDIYSPVDGTVVEVNTDLQDSPEYVNQSPLDEGWLFVLELSDPSQLDTLMTEKEYKDYIHGINE